MPVPGMFLWLSSNKSTTLKIDNNTTYVYNQTEVDRLNIQQSLEASKSAAWGFQVSYNIRITEPSYVQFGWIMGTATASGTLNTDDVVSIQRIG